MANKDFKVKNGIDIQTPLPVSMGGTGQTSTTNTLNSLLPAQSGNSGRFLSTDGTNTTWSIPAKGLTTGTTAQRPGSPANGDLYYNTDEAQIEVYQNGNWLTANVTPGIPTGVTATNQGSGRAFNNGQMSVSFTPATTGGPVKSFTITPSPTTSPATFSTTSSSNNTITGLSSNQSYTFTVTATNNFGTSSASSASSGVTATTVPQAPTVSAVAGNTNAVLTITPGATGGSAITQYSITSNPATTTQTTSNTTYTFTGLTNGTAYTFTVTSTNANGTSAASAASNSITPFSEPTWITNTTPNGGGSGGSNIYGVTVDSSGNVYGVGTIDVGGSNDWQFVKYNKNGVLQVQTFMGDGNDNRGYGGIGLDSSGNFYTSGWSWGGQGNWDMNLSKHNSSGTTVWQKGLGLGSDDRAGGMAIDSSNNIYFTGHSNNAGYAELYTVKYNSSGSLQWQRRLGSSGLNTYGSAIAVSSSGDVYVVGNSASRCLLVKYNSSGTLQWQRDLGAGSSTNSSGGVIVDSSGNIYISCSSNQLGSYTIAVLAKYNSSGTLQWQRQLDNSAQSKSVSPGNLGIDSFGNIYMGGSYSRTGSSYQGGIICKYNNSGTIQWQRTFTSNYLEDYFGMAYVDNLDMLYIGGGSYPNSTGNRGVVAKIPTDGSKTGTYGPIAGVTYSYVASSFNESAASLTGSTPSLSDNAGSLTSYDTSYSQYSGNLSTAVLSI